MYDVRSNHGPVFSLSQSRKAPFTCCAVQVENNVIASGSEAVGSDAFIDLWSVPSLFLCKMSDRAEVESKR